MDAARPASLAVRPARRMDAAAAGVISEGLARNLLGRICATDFRTVAGSRP